MPSPCYSLITMIKHCLPLLALALYAASVPAAELTAQEIRWLSAGSSVLAYAKQTLQLPLDITVQPQARASDVPLALGYQDGRCKLVLSLRGNPHSEDVLAGVPAEQHGWMIETMVAHEIGHCWRYVQGAWHSLPAGFEQAASAPELALQETRREEGYADLVALAWTAQRQPQRYAAVLGWMQQVRQPGAAVQGSHSTAAWLQLAPSASVFGDAALWQQRVDQLWLQGLQHDQ
ncbi:hypothetical protein [Pseudoduganella danionis]|uniref:hypothetical protein n=1 Tax=Pseudoduganella danionis TaxID=1890295 RepID=UPI0035B4232E